MDKSTAYRTLGLAEGAGEEEIKAAYRALAQKYGAENYEAGPLKDEAEHKMNELNEAFDMLMGLLRADGVDATRPAAPSGAVGQYPAIRQLINSGRVDEALAELSAVAGGASNAEWNFLMGSAYYYKGFLDQAVRYFQTAVQLEPNNREYQAALRNLSSSADGEMPGNPYGNPDPGGTALNCACNTCSCLCCMDACCSMCR